MTEGPIALSWTLNSAFQAVEPVCGQIKELLEKRGKATHVFAATLLLREAFTNAAEHGNHFDPKKKVACTLRIDDASLIIEIEDEGNGFDWRPHVDQLNRPSTDERGRGHNIYRLYARRIWYNGSGNHIKLYISLDD
jgi:serine/threonine-protein kinase RsbW